MRQMDAYLLFLEAWDLKCSSDETRFRLIAYFHTDRKGQGKPERQKTERTEDASYLQRDFVVSGDGP